MRIRDWLYDFYSSDLMLGIVFVVWSVLMVALGYVLAGIAAGV